MAHFFKKKNAFPFWVDKSNDVWFFGELCSRKELRMANIAKQDWAEPFIRQCALLLGCGRRQKTLRIT